MASRYADHGGCDNAFGGPSQFVHPSVSYRFPAALLGDDPDAFVYDVGEFWRSEGIQVVEDSNPGSTIIFGTRNYSAFSVAVSRESGLARVGASGPCVAAPSTED